MEQIIISPQDMANLYVVCKAVQKIRERGYNIRLMKNFFIENEKIYGSRYGRSTDKSNLDNVKFFNPYGINHENKLTNLLKEPMSAKFKNNGIAKISSTTRYELVFSETKKNSLFVLDAPDRIRAELLQINRDFPREIRDKNEPFFAFLQQIIDNNMFNYDYFAQTTYSRIGRIKRVFNMHVSGRQAPQQLPIYYTVGKFKFSMYNYDNLGIVESLGRFLERIDRYVELKENAKEIKFYSLDRETSAYDILFMPAEAVVQQNTAGQLLQIEV